MSAEPTDSGSPPAPRSAPEAIINPVREVWEAPVSPRVILTYTLPDYRFLCRLANAAGSPRYIWNCALQEGTWNGQAITLVAPAIGAPYAVAVLEKLIALGAAVVLALGWCGSLQTRAPIGAVILPETAVSGDGTSRYYFPAEGSHKAHPGLLAHLQQSLDRAGLSFCRGRVWTTDAFYRETVDLVRDHQAQGVLGVEMEMAALFAVGRFRQIPVAGLLLVSDELAEMSWQPAYRSEKLRQHFRQSRHEAARLLLAAAAQWSEHA
ncbi:MAG: nucleoside phosphorylase [Deltaproteobacteria bacterium]|nr:nucleoside phosphorylase [Deltaproteobacteria bacterium]